MAKEMLPIVLSCVVQGPILARRKVLFQCDNSTVVGALQKGSAKGNTYSHALVMLFMVFRDPLQHNANARTHCWGR